MMTRQLMNLDQTRQLVLAITLIGTLPLFADVELEVSINDVDIRGKHQLVGATTQTVNDNDFTGASNETPIFLRFSVEQGITLSETQVDLTSDDETLSRPIYLALELVGIDGDARINAPPDAVSIVRWVAGENEIWLAIESDSGTWIIDGDDNPRGPGSDIRVSFTFGISARSSYHDNGDAERSNLPFNTRELEPTGVADAVSTMICLDLSRSTLATTGIDAVVSYSFEAFEADA